MLLRDLTSLEDFRRVVELEKLIWGYTDSDDVVGVPILAVTVKRGGILIGAFAEGMVGFVYSMPALRDGRPAQWSHMLGVLPEHRNSGIGHRLKLEQRARTLAMGIDLVEWTFDPLQALNAHFNFNKLGIVASQYAVNVYGESSSPLHRGSPTDRLIAEWWVRAPAVERRLAGGAAEALPAAAIESAVAAARLERRHGWWRCDPAGSLPEAPVVGFDVPMDFPAIQRQEPELALEWRLAARQVFTAAFARGYRTLAFRLDRARGTGRYCLARSDTARG